MPPVPRLSILTASTRPHRIGHRVAGWVRGQVPAGFDVTELDLRAIALPFLDEPGQPADGHYAHEHTRRWSAAVTATDALVIVMPEYNRGYSAPLKNAIDFLYAEWEGLPVACVGYGWHGAEYARRALHQTLERVRMTVVEAPGLSFGQSVSEAGVVRADPPLEAAVARMFEELRQRARAPR